MIESSNLFIFISLSLTKFLIQTHPKRLAKPANRCLPWLVLFFVFVAAWLNNKQMEYSITTWNLEISTFSIEVISKGQLTLTCMTFNCLRVIGLNWPKHAYFICILWILFYGLIKILYFFIFFYLKNLKI